MVGGRKGRGGRSLCVWVGSEERGAWEEEGIQKEVPRGFRGRDGSKEGVLRKEGGEGGRERGRRWEVGSGWGGMEERRGREFPQRGPKGRADGEVVQGRGSKEGEEVRRASKCGEGRGGCVWSRSRAQGLV